MADFASSFLRWPAQLGRTDGEEVLQGTWRTAVRSLEQGEDPTRDLLLQWLRQEPSNAGRESTARELTEELKSLPAAERVNAEQLGAEALGRYLRRTAATSLLVESRSGHGGVNCWCIRET